MVKYSPRQGDIVGVDLDPTKGREQRGNRLTLVVSNDRFYKRTGLLIVCPISNTKNTFSLHIPLEDSLKTTGSVLTQQIRTIDPVACEISYMERVSTYYIKEILDVVELFFDDQ